MNINLTVADEEFVATKVGTFQLPEGFDDRHYPGARDFQLPPAQRAVTRIPEALPALRLRTDAPEANALLIAEKVAGSLGAGVLSEPIVIAEEAKATDAPQDLTNLEPRLRLRVQAVVCRNGDGRMSNGLPGQTRAELETALTTTIGIANTIMATANVELVFYPSADLEIVNDPYLNQDFVLPPTARAKLKQDPPLTEVEVEVLTKQYDTDPTRTQLASQYPNKMVLLFAEGTTLSQSRDLLGQAGDLPVQGDYDGDGRTDIAVFRPTETVGTTVTEGGWHICASRYGGYRFQQWGAKTDIPVPADYDGDGRTDIAVWRPSAGTWHILASGNTPIPVETLGQAGDIPVPGRYDINSRADIAVWRPATGTWHIKDSGTGVVRTVQWGQAGDIPVPADYDGDGRTDLAVWRPSNGTWYIIPSSTGVSYSRQWGQVGDKPVPGKYFGTVKADMGIYRPSEGTWHLLSSQTGATQSVRYGEAGDIAVPGNYDGDLKTDIAMWRPGTGQWYIIESQSQNHRYNDWQITPGAGGYSSDQMSYVKLLGWVNPDPADYGQAAFIAHEVGHYLHLAHPQSESNDFRVLPAEGANKTDAQLKDLIVGKVLSKLNQQRAAGTPAMSLIWELMDADEFTGVTDTLPDPGPDLFTYLNRAQYGDQSGPCGPIGFHKFTLSTGEHVYIQPDRSLVMSYFKGCSNIFNRFSYGQTLRLRNALINGNRRPLVAVQLGDTAYPGEWVVAVWNPNPNAQLFRRDYPRDLFIAEYESHKAAGLRLHSQQSYLKDGVRKYDGIWNPGDYPQDAVWDWALADFTARDSQNIASGYVLHHLESYLHPDGQFRINAIWNKGWANFPTAWLYGWTESDLAPKLTQMYNAGWRVKHLNASNLPNNGAVRYDVVWEQLTWRNEFVRLNMTLAQVAEEYGRQWNKGFKFSVLDTFRVGNEQRYAGVWNPNTNGQMVLFGHTREQINETYDEMWQQGWKLGSMAMVKF
jgi:hypothetical protein